MSVSRLLAQLGRLLTAFELDQDTSRTERRQRDREIGRHAAIKGKSARAQISHWLEQMASLQKQDTQSVNHHLAATHRLISSLLIVLGIVLGWFLAIAVLDYDGSQPINIIHALIILVGLQLLMLLIWVVLLIPFPLFTQLSHAVRFLHPGAAGLSLWHRLSQHFTRQVHNDFNPLDQQKWSHTVKWIVARWSQLFSLGLNAGIFAAIYYLVSFSDLAFGWNTTLNVENDQFHALVSSIALPWQMIQPAHVPDLHLIDISRFYRLDGALSPGLPDQLQSNLAYDLGRWWPFLVWSLLVYGMLPRLVAFIVADIVCRRSLKTQITENSASAALLARMNAPLVSTQATTDQQVPELTAPHDGLKVQLDGPLSCVVIDWGATDTSDEQLITAGIIRSAFYQAGGVNTSAHDLDVIRLVAQSAESAVVIVVRSLEPPMLDFLDFIKNLRQQCGSKLSIHIRLTAPASQGVVQNVQVKDMEIWELTLARLSDPGIFVDVLANT